MAHSEEFRPVMMFIHIQIWCEMAFAILMTILKTHTHEKKTANHLCKVVPSPRRRVIRRVELVWLNLTF